MTLRLYAVLGVLDFDGYAGILRGITWNNIDVKYILSKVCFVCGLVYQSSRFDKNTGQYLRQLTHPSPDCRYVVLRFAWIWLLIYFIGPRWCGSCSNGVFIKYFYELLSRALPANLMAQNPNWSQVNIDLDIGLAPVSSKSLPYLMLSKMYVGSSVCNECFRPYEFLAIIKLQHLRKMQPACLPHLHYVVPISAFKLRRIAWFKIRPNRSALYPNSYIS